MRNLYLAAAYNIDDHGLTGLRGRNNLILIFLFAAKTRVQLRVCYIYNISGIRIHIRQGIEFGRPCRLRGNGARYDIFDIVLIGKSL